MACIEIETNLSGFFLFLSFFFHCTCECVRDVNVVYDNAVAATVEDNDDDDDDQRIDANKREWNGKEKTKLNIILCTQING